jgi:hypothetical protein
MRQFGRRLGTFLLGVGLDPRRMWAALRGTPAYVGGFARYLLSGGARKCEFPIRLVPALSDAHLESGVAKGHYFHQDLWAAREVFKRHPKRHIDVGSRIDGFVAHLLCFREVEVIDIRPLNSVVPGLTFVRADITLPFGIQDHRADSVSCLHALEHFGLGRYGDRIAPDGWLQGLRGLATLVLPGGTLLLSVPVGRQRVEFNAQRIFSPFTIVMAAEECGLRLERFSAIGDDGAFQEQASLESMAGCDYGCGCFVFRKA